MGYTYILSNKRNGTLYVWVTSDLHKRIHEHKNWKNEWFTKKHWIRLLVWYQEFVDIQEAIDFEKKIKWKGRWFKLDLIEEMNFVREDLAKDWYL